MIVIVSVGIVLLSASIIMGYFVAETSPIPNYDNVLIQLSLMTIGSLCILYPVIIKARKVRKHSGTKHNAIDSNYTWFVISQGN